MDYIQTVAGGNAAAEGLSMEMMPRAPIKVEPRMYAYINSSKNVTSQSQVPGAKVVNHHLKVPISSATLVHSSPSSSSMLEKILTTTPVKASSITTNKQLANSYQKQLTQNQFQLTAGPSIPSTETTTDAVWTCEQREITGMASAEETFTVVIDPSGARYRYKPSLNIWACTQGCVCVYLKQNQQGIYVGMGEHSSKNCIFHHQIPQNVDTFLSVYCKLKMKNEEERRKNNKV